jgi:hypothetical protein
MNTTERTTEVNATLEVYHSTTGDKAHTKTLCQEEHFYYASILTYNIQLLFTKMFLTLLA